MRSLLVVVTAVAVLAALSGAVGFSAIIAVAGKSLSTATLVCFGTLALYCRGYRQTFFLGAFAGSFLGDASSLEVYVSGLRSLAAHALVDLVAPLVCGAVAVATRRIAERRGWTKASGP
jgi:hypothetical protein